MKIKKVLQWFMNAIKWFIFYIELDQPLYSESKVTVDKAEPIDKSTIIIGLEHRIFILRDEDSTGKVSVQEYNQGSQPISQKVFSSPNSFRFGKTPLEDIGEYLLYKVRNREALPRARN